jgi:hypothetical protein
LTELTNICGLMKGCPMSNTVHQSFEPLRAEPSLTSFGASAGDRTIYSTHEVIVLRGPDEA